ncbi:MAG: hypothetical protein II843_04220 [Alphaproteobacteria bacterium]|nr:hypothetical protein [Alphaproteobacteria bacterium]MBQ9540687.1 hypothetical protein [Alphaproteobacteria bacterium]MBR6751814.1 hypothetical protein [Alphaproteobacteria bacterium]
MEIFSIILNSSTVMYVLAFVCAVVGIRCMIHGIMGGTSTLLRILCTLLFAVLAYYCYRYAGTLHGHNMIDSFISDTWIELKQFIRFIKTKF